MWTASQVSHASSCGLDCTPGVVRRARPGANQFRFCLPPEPRLPFNPAMLDAFAQYPRWFVIACATLVAALSLWILAKFLKWTLWLLLIAVIVAGGALVVWTLFK